MERELKIHGVYRHFKGKYYLVEGIATHSETKEQMVVYRHLYGDGELCVRPLDMFLSETDHEKYPDNPQQYRFELVDGFSEPQKLVQPVHPTAFQKNTYVIEKKNTYFIENEYWVALAFAVLGQPKLATKTLAEFSIHLKNAFNDNTGKTLANMPIGDLPQDYPDIYEWDGQVPHYLKLKVPTLSTINELTKRFIAYIPNDIIVAGYEAGKGHYSDPEEICQKK